MRGPLLLLFTSVLLSSCAGLGYRPQNQNQGRQEIDWFPSGFYAGAMFGASQLDVSGREIDRDLADRGYAATTDLDDSDFAFNAYVGYRFDAPIGIELGYANLGQVESTIDASPADTQAFLDDIAEVHPVLGRGVQLQGRWYVWKNERIELSVAGGLWAWEGDFDARAGTGESVSMSLDGIDPTVGFAMTLGLKNRWDLRAAWDRYYLDGDAADAFTLGIQIGLN